MNKKLNKNLNYNYTYTTDSYPIGTYGTYDTDTYTTAPYVTTTTHSNTNTTHYYPVYNQEYYNYNEYQEEFNKLISRVLGSNISEEFKDTYINICIGLKSFRKYIKEYFPKYIDKIILWETLHPNEIKE